MLVYDGSYTKYKLSMITALLVVLYFSIKHSGCSEQFLNIKNNNDDDKRVIYNMKQQEVIYHVEFRDFEIQVWERANNVKNMK